MMYKPEIDVPTFHNVDSSNTQDAFVPNPKPERHIWAKMASSGQADMPAQPNEVNYSHRAGCRFVWTGYVKIDAPVSNPTLLVGADDWGKFVLDAFNDHPAEVLRPQSEIGPFQGGHYKENSVQIEDATLQPGFYRATISYVNVNYEGAGDNRARLVVKLNGNDVELCSLTAVNLMRKEEADKFRKGYEDWFGPEPIRDGNESEEEFEYRKQCDPHGPVDYGNTPDRSAFWTKFHFDPEIYKERLLDMPCASRLSVAINRAGYDIGPYMIAGTQAADNTAKWGSDLIVLNPEAASSSERTMKHILRSAKKIRHFLKNSFFAGKQPDFTEDDYLHYDAACNPRKGDIIIFASDVHSGLCLDGSSRSSDSYPQGDAWILHRSDWAEPGS